MILAVLVGGLAFLVFLLSLQRRWFGRFTHGFLFSIAIAIAGTAVAAAGIVGRWGYTRAADSVDREITVSLENVAAIVDSQVQANLRQMRGTLDRLAGTIAPIMQRPSSDDLQQRLRSVQAYTRYYLQLRVLDARGDLLAASDDTLPEPINRVAVAYALDGTPYVSEAFRSTGYKSEVVALAVPIRGPSGEVIGVITSVFDMQAMLEELVAHTRFNQSGNAMVVDGAGDVIAHPDKSQVGTNIEASEAVQRARITRRPGSIVATNAKGVERQFYYYPLASPATTGREPWIILSEINESEALAVFGQLARQALAAVALVFLLSLLLAHQVATSIGRPLDSLKQFAARLGRGELDAEVDVQGRDVAGSLAASLNAMATGLRERDRVKEVFGRYIATQVSDRILSGEVNLGGEARVVSILFSDIRNFTTMSEDMTPQQVVSFLNAYFSEMVEAVFEQGGILDKFLGDGLMAVFGSLNDQPDHAARAVRTALRMKALLGKINGERAVAGKPPVSIGIGIHTAEVIVGNIGSTKRLEYTVIGDGVNTSSRVQALNKEFGTTILITEDTHAAVDGQFECREMPATPLRGKQRPLKFYEVLALREAAVKRGITAGEESRIAPVA